jgi:hypothetical protein
MKLKLLIALLLLIAGCHVRGPSPTDDRSTPKPQATAIVLRDITEALADEIPASIVESDQLILVLEDLVRVHKLTDAQQKQIKAALPNVNSVRPLTGRDADLVRAVK